MFKMKILLNTEKSINKLYIVWRENLEKIGNLYLDIQFISENKLLLVILKMDS